MRRLAKRSGLLGAALLRIHGIRRRFGTHRYTTEELQTIVWESEEEGLIGPQSAQVLSELVDFGQLTAREAMIPRVKILGIETGASLEARLAELGGAALAEAMEEWRAGRIVPRAQSAAEVTFARRRPRC